MANILSSGFPLRPLNSIAPLAVPGPAAENGFPGGPGPKLKRRCFAASCSMFSCIFGRAGMPIWKSAAAMGCLATGLLSAVAQQPYGFPGPHGPGAYGNVGHGYHFPGAAQPNIVIPYGPAGMVQQPMGMGTSAATYSNGRMVAGAVRTPQGVVHLSNGLVVGPGNAVGPMGLNFGLPGNPYPMEFPSVAEPMMPYGAPYPYGLPHFGGWNANYPGSVLGSTLQNMSYSMRPSVPSTAVYTRPPLMFMTVPQFEEAADGFNAEQIPDAPPSPAPQMQTPLLNEFDAFPRGAGDSSLPDRINSLRYQSVGDEAFRNEDYSKASESYKAGLSLSPDRRALWIRMAFVSIATENFADATRYLKTGLLTSPDATRAWISADELYGERAGERARSHGSKLWNWLAEEPLSSDRLLLGGTFQKLRGFDGAAAELLQMASHEGAEADAVASVMALAEGDIGQRAVSQQLGQMINESKRSNSAATVSRPRSAKPVVDAPVPGNSDSEAIILRGTTESSETAEGPPADTLEPQSPPLFIPRL